jgi:hypothetical protein
MQHPLRRKDLGRGLGQATAACGRAARALRQGQAPSYRNLPTGRGVGRRRKERSMRGVLLWLIGIPIPIIILLYLFNVL